MYSNGHYSSFCWQTGLTKPEVIGNTILFLNAGFQTTADTMVYVFYELAVNPEVQQKVCLILCKNQAKLF